MTDLPNPGILLVEDSPVDILFIQRAFKRVNVSSPIYVVNDGDAAVDYLSGSGNYGDREAFPLPNLILLDLKLPRRSGLEVLEWIRQQPVVKRIPVIVLTSSREDIDVDRAYDLGVSSYLVKPLELDALSKMVEIVCDYWLSTNQFPNVYLA